MTAIIVEDEQIAQRRLRRLIDDTFEDGAIEIVQVFDSLKETAAYLQANPHPEILFLDILLSDGNSFDLFDMVDVESAIIFTTAYNEFAVDAFRSNAVDYLMKPIKAAQLKEAVDKIGFHNQGDSQVLPLDLEPFKSRFLVRFGSKLHSIKTADIAYVYSENKLGFFILWDGRRIASDLTLNYLSEKLDPDHFFRVNRQFIVHIDAISEMLAHSKSRIILRLNPASREDVVVSTETARVFKQWLNR